MQGVMSKIKSGVINRTSDIISAPARMRSYRVQKQDNADVKAIKAYRAIKGKPIEPYNESNPDFRTKMNAINAVGNVERRARTIKK